MEFVWKNIRINLGWNSKINNTMVIDSKVMTTCMSPFSKPLLDFGLMPKQFTVTKTCPFANVVGAFVYGVISPLK
jgi:hypothetical protein